MSDGVDSQSPEDASAAYRPFPSFDAAFTTARRHAAVDTNAIAGTYQGWVSTMDSSRRSISRFALPGYAGQHV